MSKEITDYSAGIDSMRFVMPKASLLKFLKKIELYGKLRKTTRNKLVQKYCADKFKQDTQCKRHPFNVRYINLKRGVKSLSNTIIVLENTKELHKLAREHKKSLDYYVMVVFAGLHQPSKDVNAITFKILGKFQKRFCVYSCDVAVDFDYLGEIDYTKKEWFQRILQQYYNGLIISVGKSLYANNCDTQLDFYKIDKILLYDKYFKQTQYHKQNIAHRLKHWKRLETTFILKRKFRHLVDDFSIFEMIKTMSDLMTGFGLCDVNFQTFFLQASMSRDLRVCKSLKAWACA